MVFLVDIRFCHLKISSIRDLYSTLLFAKSTPVGADTYYNSAPTGVLFIKRGVEYRSRTLEIFSIRKIRLITEYTR